MSYVESKKNVVIGVQLCMDSDWVDIHPPPKHYFWFDVIFSQRFHSYNSLKFFLFKEIVSFCQIIYCFVLLSTTQSHHYVQR